jgi:hypothetical protein
MHFLIGLAIVLGIIYGMIVSPSFRVAGLIVIGAAAMLLWMAIGDPFGWKQAEHEAQKRAWPQAEAGRLASEQAALTAIKPAELALSGVTYNEARTDDRQTLLGWTLDGTVTNNSPDRVLESLKFEVTVRERTEPSARIIGQETVGLCNGVFPEDHLAIPPGQARSFHSCKLELKNLPPTRAPVWTYRIIEIRAGGTMARTVPAPSPVGLVTDAQRK